MTKNYINVIVNIKLNRKIWFYKQDGLYRLVEVQNSLSRLDGEIIYDFIISQKTFN